jgi:hypothetical protein
LYSSSLEVVFTQNEAKVAFTHILHVVFGQDSGTPLQIALEEEGIDDIFKLLNLDSPTINNLKHTVSNNNNSSTFKNL